ESVSDDPRGFGERAGVGAGVVQTEIAAGWLGGEPIVACCDDDPASFAFSGELEQVRVVGQSQPEVQTAARYSIQARRRGVLAECVDEEIAAAGELLPERAQVRAPGRLCDDIDRDGLQGGADVHLLSLRVRENAITGGAARDQAR